MIIAENWNQPLYKQFPQIAELRRHARKCIESNMQGEVYQDILRAREQQAMSEDHR
jgi:hypothetical protein